jgi:hypothetical protein
MPAFPTRRQLEVADGRTFSLRHVFPDTNGSVTLLGRTYAALRLPMSHAPDSPDLTTGSYTLRMNDAGEFSLTFPNAVGSGEAGLWRDRFDPEGHLEFIEVYRDDLLEFVGLVVKVDIDRGQVVISGYDGMWLLRKAYEQDRAWTHAPRDAWEAYTKVPVAVLADDFEGTSLGTGWSSTGATVSVANGELTLSAGSISYDLGSELSDTWRIVLAISRHSYSVDLTGITALNGLYVTDSSGNYLALVALDQDTHYAVDLATGAGGSGGLPIAPFPLKTLPPGPGGTLAGGVTFPATLTLERQGRWVRAYAGNRLVGYLPWQASSNGQKIYIHQNGGIDGAAMVIDQVAVFDQQSLLLRGTDVGDYVLPGDYPSGGLHGRYFNDQDLQGLATSDRYAQILSPSREPYVERLDAKLDGTSISVPKPGSTGSYWSVRWFGAIYLKLSQGDYTIGVSLPGGCRLWIGKTGWGDELIDSWSTVASQRNLSETLDADSLGGKDGWYPMVLEYHEDATQSGKPNLQFVAPASYTDPGGSSIGTSSMSVPSTSLSPLGCFDQRVQGTSHLDVIQQLQKAFGYQTWCEPQQLESGEFPGRLAPNLRVGRDTDVVLEVEDTDSAERVLSPSKTLDAGDLAKVLRGQGAGVPDGGQTVGQVVDVDGAKESLFALEAWVDASDITFPQLLAARLDAELALRDSPWEQVTGQPLAQARLADTFPLSGTLALMRWRPGDGIRLSIPDLSVEDTSTRQILQVDRQFGPEGLTASQVGWRERPRSGLSTVRGLLRAAMVPQRVYQGTIVVLQGQYVRDVNIAASGYGDFGRVPLLPSDRVVRAVLRIVQTNSTSTKLELNGVDVTSDLGGPWTAAPVEIDITGLATQAAATDNRLYARLQNAGAAAATMEHQIIVEVLR